MSTKTVILISQVHPYPHYDGGRMDVFYRIKALAELGYDVILISFYNPLLTVPENSVLDRFCKRIFTIPYQRRSYRKFLSLKPYSIACREVWNELDPVFDNLKREKIDAVIAESPHVVTVAERAKKRLDIPRLYIRSHNDEPRFMRSVALSSPTFSIERVFFLAEAFKYTRFLPKMMSELGNSASIWHISFDECREFADKYPSIKHHFLPAGIDLTRLQKVKDCSSKKVLFAGALYSPNNIHGLQWYLKEVHPLMLERDKEYQLIIAGNTAGANPTMLKRIKNNERVIFYDTPGNMEPIYEEAQVFINPMLLGAGVKLKTIDAAIQGLPVVTTSIGNEGTGLSHQKEVLVGDTPEEFAGHLFELLSQCERCRDLSESAVKFLKRNYDQKQSLKKLMDQ